MLISLFAIWIATTTAEGQDLNQQVKELFAKTNNLNPIGDSLKCSPKAQFVIVEQPIDPKVCEILKTYPREKNADLDFHSGKYSICEPTFAGSPPWKSTPQVQMDSTLKTYKNPTPKEMEKFGLRKMTPNEFTDFARSIEKFRDEFSSSCCGFDQKCASLIKKIPIKACHDPEATAPDKPDRCLASEYATFQMSIYESNRIWYELHILSGKDPGVLQASLIGDGLDPKKILEMSYPVPGVIRLNRYRYENSSYVKASDIRHELGHACLSIHHQLLAQKSIHQREDFLRRLTLKDTDGDYCNLSNEDRSIYHRAISEVLGSGTAQCLIQVSQLSAQKDHPLSLEDNCAYFRLEESFAIAMELRTVKKNEFPALIPKRLCDRYPTKLHPPPSPIFECLVQHDHKYRRRVYGYLCSK